MKKCTKCKIEKKLSEFSKDSKTKDGYCYRCKECAKKYREENKKKIEEYRKEKKEEIAEYNKEYHRKNRKELLERMKKYNKGNKKELAKNNKEHYQENRKEILRKAKIYNERPEVKKRINRHKKQKRKNNPQIRLNESMTTAIYHSLKGNKAGRHWENLVKYTLKELKEHLESLFESWMTWDNYGDWEIDHIKPKSLFNFENPEDEEFQECWALENLQPLEKSENRKKYNCYKN